MAFQSPKGTRDFFPADMALRRFIEDTWRRVSLRHGFVEVDGPTFEYLDLYKVKSGDEIVSQLFHFESRGEDKTQFALRPEFTPTLARMVAAKANSLPRPIKWFSIPRCYRAERPQKGRLREFIQWNVDMLGGETPEAQVQFDLEVAALCLDCLRDLGITKGDVKLNWSHREITRQLLLAGKTPEQRLPKAFSVIDKLQKIKPAERPAFYREMECSDSETALFEKIANGGDITDPKFFAGEPLLDWFPDYQPKLLEVVEEKQKKMKNMGIGDFCHFDIGIVRGLAYYTGFVWEIVDSRGENRAIAGGGRYDRLIETFGGPPLPAVGFGMGDVVLADVLKELGKLPPIDQSLVGGQPDVFIINALESAATATQLAGEIRASHWDAATKKITRPGIATALSYKASKNIGKQMPDAVASGARLAVILAPSEFARGIIKLKDLRTREEEEVPAAHVVEAIRSFFHPPATPAAHLRHSIQRARRHSNEWSVSGANPLRIASNAGPQMGAGKTQVPIQTPGNASAALIHPPGGAESRQMRHVTLKADNREEATFVHLIRWHLGKE